MKENHFIGANKAKEILHISKSTVYLYVREGKIPAYKIYSGKVLFKEQELIDFIESCKITPPSKPEHIKLPEEPRIKVQPTTKEEVLNRLKEL